MVRSLIRRFGMLLAGTDDYGKQLSQEIFRVKHTATSRHGVEQYQNSAADHLQIM